MLEDRGWTQDDLAAITGIRRQTFSGIISGKSGITPEMAVTLATVFGNSASEWLLWDNEYRLSAVHTDVVTLGEKRKLYESAPIREMQKRGWIKNTDSVEELKEELKQFFGSGEVDFSISFKRTARLPTLSPSERAWCFRTRRIASALPPVATFKPERMPELEKRLRELATYTKEARHLAKLFSEFGIRFLIVEPLPTTKIDGAAFWLGPTSPVIVVSMRLDRIDNFWFTVFHEFKHIQNGDSLSVDSGLVGDDPQSIPVLIQEESEGLANEEAAGALVPQSELESFIRRVGPLYSKQRIVQFAHRIKIHPGIIVGQLQRRAELGYSSHRDLLPKIRDVVTETAITDGWGEQIPSTLL
jgi:HTH-type transcriptional regulator/antitoxin HigA